MDPRPASITQLDLETFGHFDLLIFDFFGFYSFVYVVKFVVKKDV